MAKGSRRRSRSSRRYHKRQMREVRKQGHEEREVQEGELKTGADLLGSLWSNRSELRAE